MKKGDTVLVLDDNLEGTIVSFLNDTVLVETVDGFEITYEKQELVVLENPISSHEFSVSNISEVLKNKEVVGNKNTKRQKPRERVQPAMEVDLHIHQLVPSQRGLSNYDMLEIQIDTAKRQLNFAMQKGIQRVVFIHGIGAGVLRQELEYLFRGYDAITFEDANFQKYGRGATEIYIHQSKL
jgi:dsDNA-specific endonuclease/ATPase MutS2